MHSDSGTVSPKPFYRCKQDQQDFSISKKLISAVGSDRLMTISSKTGFNAETARRYIQGESRITAVFVRQIAMQYNCDANSLLDLPPYLEPDIFRQVTTDKLINELARRMQNIENCAIAQALLNEEKRDKITNSYG